MKVLIIGCGAVGVSIAASLSECGVQTDLIARGRTAEAIRRGGIERRGIFQPVTIPAERLQVFESARESGSGYDFIIVSSKTTGNPEIASDLESRARDILAPGGLLVLFQNGFGNERYFLHTFNSSAICLASFAIGFQRPQPNISEVTVFSSPVQIGRLGGGTPENAKKLAEAVDRGGIPCAVTEEIGKTVWAKLLYNCSLNPLSAILHVNYGGLVTSDSSVWLVKAIIDETFAVMRAAGYETFWKDADSYKKEFFERILPPTFEHRSSTLQDMERKIPTEIDSLNGAVTRLGKENNVPVPVNETIVRLVKAAEGLYH